VKKKIIIGVVLVVCGLGAGFFSLFAFAQVTRDENYAADLRIRAVEKRAEEPTVLPGGIEAGPSSDQIQAEADAYLADAERADADSEVQTILAWSLVSGGVVLVGVAVLLFVSAARTRNSQTPGDPNATVVIQHV
jgi:hypothetical protein